MHLSRVHTVGIFELGCSVLTRQLCSYCWHCYIFMIDFLGAHGANSTCKIFITNQLHLLAVIKTDGSTFFSLPFFSLP
jgi:hypothetical protein